MTQANNPPRRNAQRYPYIYPPWRGEIGPYIEVGIRAPGANRSQEIKCTALLGTGSERTLVPSFLLGQIGAQPSGEASIVGIDDRIQYVRKFRVELEFNRLYRRGKTIEWPAENKRFIIIGRDLMRKYCITFDAAGAIGPELHFYIQLP